VAIPEAEKECLINPSGRGYMGTKNMSANGSPCLPWTEAPAEVTAFLPDNSTLSARNYCRNIRGQGWEMPYCLVDAYGGFGKNLEPCYIDYCGSKVFGRNAHGHVRIAGPTASRSLFFTMCGENRPTRFAAHVRGNCAYHATWFSANHRRCLVDLG